MKRMANAFVFLGLTWFGTMFIQGAIPSSEREALIALFNSTGGDSWTNQTGWKTLPLHTDGFAMPGTEGSWEGITVSGDRVTMIWLVYNNLTGTIPSQIGNLTNLTELHLGGNQLTGTIPSQIGNLTSLMSLSLGFNQLTGTIPTEIGNLTSLTDLSLGPNQLTGAIPSQIGNLTNLVELYLTENQLTGAIPTEIGSLTSLTNLALAYNKLTGTIPTWIGNLASLVHLSLNDNQLTGAIPTEIGNLISLTDLVLGSNQLTGTIPPDIGKLTSLKTLHLSSNQLTGTIPTWIGNLFSLTGLWLNSNQLTGVIPIEIGNLTSLAWLSLNSNQLTGGIPTQIGNLTSLQNLYLGSNQLTGTMPTQIGSLTNLTTLSIGYNKLVGQIPVSMVNLVNLSSGITDIGFNALWSNDATLRTFLNSKDSDWEATQTIAPVNVHAVATSSTSITLSWTPISYFYETGGYRVYVSTTPGGTYAFFNQTSTKTNNSMLVTGLTPFTTFYFVVTSRTNAHGEQQNIVDSEYSTEVHATTFGIQVTSPNGGESWHPGDSRNITWNSTGTTANVNIYYSTNSGSSWNQVVSNTINDGSYSWLVPSESSSTCLIRINDSSNVSIYDVSDAVFTISVAETVSAPNIPSGPGSGMKDNGFLFSTAGSTSSLGHSIQYRFDWNDGSTSGWLPTGTTQASHSWSANGAYQVRAMARCTAHTWFESSWSDVHVIAISPGYANSPSNRQILPEVIWAPATGGGTWVSEVQVVDMTGGSRVSVYYNASGGRQGPFVLWDNNSGAAGGSIKYGNMLQTIDGLDAGAFTYSGTVGAVEFVTQDASHLLHVAARTVNGDYSKTFPGLNDVAANTADTSRQMVIPNVTTNATYRSSLGCFNPSANSVTVEFRLVAASGGQVGSTFSRTLNGYGFQSFYPFTEAGIGSGVYDNVSLYLTPTSGTGRIMPFGASANNYTNDPAAHIAVQAGSGYESSPSNRKILPEVIWAPATGGGTWVSEVQVVDITGGSQVSVYYSTSSGRRGPFLLWNNNGGTARSSMKYDNMLQTIDGLDAGAFAYNGTVGAVEFATQDGSHLLHVAARTLNGDYSKTFPALTENEANTADITRQLVVPNMTNNAAYRSTVGCFNPGADSVTVEFRLLDGNGAQIGSLFTRTFAGFSSQAFYPFTEAGMPYPAYSYDNVKLIVRPTSGTGKIFVFGASANNNSNDPAAHMAVQGE
jgi:Leucine-rich repeat (LRR) protein